MENFIIKVSGLKSINKALELESYGVNLLGFDSKVIQNDNKLDLTFLLEAKEKLSIAHISHNLSFANQLIESNFDMNNDFFEIPNNNLLNEVELDFLSKKEVKLISTHIEASYDDDPNWIIDDKPIGLGIDEYYQIDLFSDVENSWEYIKNEVLEGELQINDIIELCDNNKTLISLDFHEENIGEIISSIPSAKGIHLKLSDGSEHKTQRSFDYDQILRVVKKVSSLH